MPTEQARVRRHRRARLRLSAESALAVRKTYKLFIGGAFPRSESGRTYPVTLGQRRVPRQRRARLAQGRPGRGGRGPRRGARAGPAPPPTTGARSSTGSPRCWRAAGTSSSPRYAPPRACSADAAAASVDAAIDRWVWYAGWTDKIAQVYGNANPVAGPFFNLSSPEPTGVVGVVAPPDSSLLGLVSVIAPAIVTGNTVVVLTSDDRPLPAITLAEVLATSDLPGGVVNILTGRVAETAPHLAAHMDVNAIDLTGVTDPELATALEVAAADNLKRVIRAGRDPDWTADPGTDRMTALLETKTVWHPKGV